MSICAGGKLFRAGTPQQPPRSTAAADRNTNINTPHCLENLIVSPLFAHHLGILGRLGGD
jgi:hypothetical protein